MKYVLIFFFIGFKGYGAATISVEFDDIAACNSAANVLTRAFDGQRGFTISTCVPRGF